MPESSLSQGSPGALTTIDMQEEEQDAKRFKDLCDSRLRLLQQQYLLMKDCLNKSMVISDIWWAAHNMNNIDQKRRYGTKLIDEVIHPYLHKIDALVKQHEDEFKQDEIIHLYFEFCEEALARIFTPAAGITVDQAYSEKGLAVRLAEVDEIQAILKVFRENFGRKILLEKAAQGFGIRHLLSSSASESSSWSWLWSASTKDEDRMLWVTFPVNELENVQRRAFNVVKKERVTSLENKIDYVEDYWQTKQQLQDDEPLLDDDDDVDWATEFADSTAKKFTYFIEDVKLRLMKDCSMSNFRFMAPLTGQIVFEEHQYAKRLGDCDKENLYEYVQYRLDRLDAEKGHIERMEFCSQDTNDNA